MKVSRKKFIKQLAGLSVVASALPSVLNAKQKPRTKPTIRKKTAIVVGAGLSGLVAAHELKKKGFQVKVLEATSQSGGRIKTHEEDGLTAELGGEWISKNQKEILGLLRELGLKTEEHSMTPDISLGGIIKSSGTWDLTQDYKDTINKLVSVYKNMSQKQKKGLDKISFYNYMSYQGVSARDLKIADLGYSLSYGESIRHISAEKVLFDLSHKSSRFGRDLKIKNGNIRLIHALEKSIGKSVIFYSDPVERISQNSSEVSVKTRSGKTYDAEICVFTVPPAAMHPIKWVPELPRDKVLASIQLKYGRISKSLLVFDRKTWNRDDFAVISDGPVEMFYHATPGQSMMRGILAAVTTGDKSEMFQGNDEKNRKLFFSAGMKGAGFQKEGRFEIKNVSFEESPYIRGSVSVYSGGSFSAKESLTKPHNRVFFAGEHLGEITGTMNSAVDSALNVLKMI